jgi:hypothetical protein
MSDTHTEADTLAATDDPPTVVDDQGRATTPLHEAMTAAVESAGDNEPHGGTASGDDENNDSDSGDDVSESLAGDDSTDDDRTKTVTPVDIFQRYASTRDARDAAEQFQPKQWGAPGGNSSHPSQFGERLSGLTTGGAANAFHSVTTDAVQDQDSIRIVGGSSATMDSNAERAALSALNDRQRAHGPGADTTVEQAAYAAAAAPLLNVRAAAPLLVPLMPLERTPTPVE